MHTDNTPSKPFQFLSSKHNDKPLSIEIVIKDEPNPNGEEFMEYLNVGEEGPAFAYLYLPNMINAIEKHGELKIRHY